MAEIIVVHGPPGSGKTTHCERLVKVSPDNTLFHLSTGNRLRAIRTNQVDSAFKDSILLPREKQNTPVQLDHKLVDSVVFEFVASCPPQSIVLIDGYPSFVDAIDIFMDSIHTNRHDLLGCINFKLSEETSRLRLKNRGSRLGEKQITDDFIQKRISHHYEVTVPAVKVLEKLVPTIIIDAEPSEEQVWGLFFNAYVKLATVTP